MPPTDYSGTVIYEIKCKNPQVKFVHIGATTNLNIVRHRFCKLKIETTNPKLFQQIVDNGGVANWEVVVLEAYTECTSKTESNSRVIYWRNRINNPEPQTRNNQNEFYCKYCDCNYSNKVNYEKHLLTPKHKKNKTHHRKSTRIEPSKKCQHCSQEFSTVSSLRRHKPRCKILKEEENVLEARIQYLENELQKYKNIVDQLSRRHQATDTNQITI